MKLLRSDHLEAIDAALRVLDTDHSTIVIDNESPAIDSSRFVVSGVSEIDRVSDRIFTNHMHSRFSISDNVGTAEVIASILSGKPVGTNSARHIYQTFTETLTESETEKLKELLKVREGQAIDATVLDELVEEVTGFKTTYFKRSLQDNSARYPFLFEESRQVSLEGEVLPEVRIILKDGKTFYPAKQLLTIVGYDVKSNERSIYIENELRQFRFPKKELFYVYNERKFNVGTMPFEMLDDEFYFEESWFKRLFLLSIDKSGRNDRHCSNIYIDGER